MKDMENTVISIEEQDYISLTNMATAKAKIAQLEKVIIEYFILLNGKYQIQLLLWTIY